MYPHQVVYVPEELQTISGLSAAKLPAIKTGYGCVFADEFLLYRLARGGAWTLKN
jgi:hypothetical protein